MLAEVIKREKIVVWGGGGTLPLLEMMVPHAQFASVRTGKGRDGKDLITNPEVVVWAVGAMKDLKSPPLDWEPELVVDLNYFDHSPGIEYALRVGAIYMSGIQMFLAQAEEQRKFWNKYEW